MTIQERNIRRRLASPEVRNQTVYTGDGKKCMLLTVRTDVRALEISNAHASVCREYEARHSTLLQITAARLGLEPDIVQVALSESGFEP